VALVAGVGGLVTSVATLWRVRAQNAQDFASAGQQVTQAAAELVASIREQLQDLRHRVETLEDENRLLRWQLTQLQFENHLLRQAVRRLIFQVQSLGADPVVDPDAFLQVQHAQQRRTGSDEADAK